MGAGGEPDGKVDWRTIPSHIVERYQATVVPRIAHGRRRAVGYLRESTPGQIETSHPRQHGNVDQHAAKHNLDMVEKYSDEGVTGTSTYDRHDFRRMMRDAREKRFDVIVFEDVDRLSRSLSDLLTCYEELLALGIEVHDCKHGKLDLVHVVVLGLIGAQGRIRFIDLCKGGRRNAAAGGKIFHAPIYGYRKHPKEKGIHVIVQTRAAIVRQVFEMVASGLGTSFIASELSKSEMSPRQCYLVDNGESVPGRPVPWYAVEIRNIIRNPLYTGLSIYGKTSPIREFTTKRIVGYEVQPPQEWVLAQVPQYRIVDPALAARAVQALQQKVFGGGSAANRAGTHLLAGRIFCAACGARSTIVRRNDRDAYVCSDHLSAAPGACPVSVSMRLDLLERAVVRAVAEHALGPVAQNAYRARYEAACRVENARRLRRLKTVEGELAAIDEALECELTKTMLTRLLTERAERFFKERQARELELGAEKRMLSIPVGTQAGFQELDHLEAGLARMLRELPFRPTDPEGEILAQKLRRLIRSVHVHARDEDGVAKVDLIFDRDKLAGLAGLRAEKVADPSRAIALLIDVKGVQTAEREARYASTAIDDSSATIHDLDDEAWAFVAPAAVKLKPGQDKALVDARLILDGVIFILKTGGSFEKCPPRFGEPGAFFRAVYRLVHCRAWDEIKEILQLRRPDVLAGAALGKLDTTSFPRGTGRRRKGKLERRPPPQEAKAEAATLRALAEVENDLPTKRRFALVALHLEGWDTSAIAETLQVAKRVVYRTVSNHRMDGVLGLRSSAAKRAATGRVKLTVARLDAATEADVVAVAKKGVDPSDSSRALTYKRLIDYCFGLPGQTVRYSRQGMLDILRRNGVCLGAITAPAAAAAAFETRRLKAARKTERELLRQPTRPSAIVDPAKPRRGRRPGSTKIMRDAVPARGDRPQRGS